MSRVIESVNTFHVWVRGYRSTETWVVRVWREESVAEDRYDNSGLQTSLHQYLDDRKLNVVDPDKAILAERLAALPRVNAVEVRDAAGNGLKIRVS